jgi:hypothetical protein
MASFVLCLELGLIRVDAEGWWCLKVVWAVELEAYRKLHLYGFGEDLTWIIQCVDHNTWVGAINLLVGILGSGQNVKEKERG